MKLSEDVIPLILTFRGKYSYYYVKNEHELKRMEQNGVILRPDDPTESCASMVVRKSNNTVRVWVDLTQLNRYAKRENQPLPSMEATFAKLAGANFFLQTRRKFRILANKTFAKFTTIDHNHDNMGALLLQ